MIYVLIINHYVQCSQKFYCVQKLQLLKLNIQIILHPNNDDKYFGQEFEILFKTLILVQK